MTPSPSEDPAVETLLAHAEGYADHMLRTTGSVTPALFLDTPAGEVFCILAGPDMTEATKDKMVHVCRMLAVSTRATASALVMEAWMVRAKEGKLDTDTRPSLNPDREEVVNLMAENLRGMRGRILAIQRDDAGAYAGLGESNMPDANGGEGRFVGILPQQTPDIRAVMQARFVTRSMGLIPEGCRPEWN